MGVPQPLWEQQFTRAVKSTGGGVPADLSRGGARVSKLLCSIPLITVQPSDTVFKLQFHALSRP